MFVKTIINPDQLTRMATTTNTCANRLPRPVFEGAISYLIVGPSVISSLLSWVCALGLRDYARNEDVGEPQVKQVGLVWIAIGVASILIPISSGIRSLESSSLVGIFIGVGMIPVSLLLVAVGVNAYYIPEDVIAIL